HAGEPERRGSEELVGPRAPVDRQHEHPAHAGRHADRREIPGGSRDPTRAAEAEARRGRARLSVVRGREGSRRASDAASEAAVKPAAALVAACLAIASLATAGAQVPKPAENNITPAYEGWLPNADGSFDLVF